MRQIWIRLFGGRCEHLRAVEVESVGIRRVVCESCSHVSFEMVDDDIARERREQLAGPELPRAVGL